MNAGWVGLGAIAGIVLLYAINKVIHEIRDARDTIEDVLDAVLNPTMTGRGWTTDEPPVLSVEESALWDEIEAHLRRSEDA